jgi:hypothetical protein
MKAKLLLAFLSLLPFVPSFGQEEKYADSINKVISLLETKARLAHHKSRHPDGILQVAYAKPSKQIVWAEMYYPAYGGSIRYYFNESRVPLKVRISEPTVGMTKNVESHFYIRGEKVVYLHGTPSVLFNEKKFVPNAPHILQEAEKVVK